MAEQRVASWYWITTAALTPLALVVSLAWVYYTHQLQANRAEGRQLREKLEAGHKQWDPLNARIQEVSTLTGFGQQYTEIEPGAIEQPTPFSTEKERGAPREKRSPLLQYYLDAEERFWGATQDESGYLHDYVNARARLDAFEGELEGYIAVKSYQHYTVKTIALDGVEAAEVSGDLSRTLGDLNDPNSKLPQAAIDEATRKRSAGEEPADETMRKPTKITLELIFRKQTRLIRDLVAANHHQYALLLAGVADTITTDDGKVSLGYLGEEARKKKIQEVTDLIRRDIEEMKNGNLEVMRRYGNFADAAAQETEAKIVNLDTMVAAAQVRIEDLQRAFESEKTGHAADAAKYDEMIRNLRSLKNPITLEKADPDGEVTYSDDRRGTVHIDLGSADGVRAGQRFEVWRMHGRESDQLVGVVEIVRTLSSHYSLCTVLSLNDESEPVRIGDKLVNRLWHDGEFLTVALHGSFEPPDEAYSKERLSELLRQSGVRVVDRVQPGTDVVIFGSRLLGDAWYRQARNALRFESVPESEVRLYIDPR